MGQRKCFVMKYVHDISYLFYITRFNLLRIVDAFLCRRTSSEKCPCVEDTEHLGI